MGRRVARGSLSPPLPPLPPAPPFPFISHPAPVTWNDTLLGVMGAFLVATVSVATFFLGRWHSRTRSPGLCSGADLSAVVMDGTGTGAQTQTCNCCQYAGQPLPPHALAPHASPTWSMATFVPNVPGEDEENLLAEVLAAANNQEKLMEVLEVNWEQLTRTGRYTLVLQVRCC